MPAELPEACDPRPLYSKLTTQMQTTTSAEERENEQEHVKVSHNFYTENAQENF